MAHRSPKSCGGRCKHILSVAVPYSAMTRNQQCELGVSLTMSKWNTNHLPSALKVPFLPEIENRQYTLVLDLDETLVHYQEVFILKNLKIKIFIFF